MAFRELPSSLLHRLEEVINRINSFDIAEENNTADDFYETGLSPMPKKFKEKSEDETSITNQISQNSYEVDQDIIFANLSIELHLVTILWIMRYGSILDASFGNS